MQSATCTNLRIDSISDACVIFHAVRLKILPMVTRRLNPAERNIILPGSVYVWEEGGIHGAGMERWTDGEQILSWSSTTSQQSNAGRRWGHSRLHQGFLFYQEKATSHGVFPRGISQELLIKQTCFGIIDTAHGKRKWHLAAVVAYSTEQSVGGLNSIDNHRALQVLNMPHGKYIRNRSMKGHIFTLPYVRDVTSDPHKTSTLTRSTLSLPDIEHSLTWDGPHSAWGDHRRQAKAGTLLVPLKYLETITPPPRHPVDETALKLLGADPCSFPVSVPSHDGLTVRPNAGKRLGMTSAARGSNSLHV
ncbi:hypothetical protein B0H17DRAFT_1124025 [Mycena rosella]|uniref:Uncharacterized protein n=1 Tax=Mycena rosella TaxID=1033263 RepID=A0AAD7MCN2_MYCRO|nr:hypothetical protein B0H17DRAFT_1124025 [Mycena rosella]